MSGYRCTLESASKIAAQIGDYIPQTGVVATPVPRSVNVVTPLGQKIITAYFSADGAAMRLQCPYTSEWFEFALASFNFRRLTREAHPYALASYSNGYGMTSWPNGYSNGIGWQGGGRQGNSWQGRRMGALPTPSPAVTNATIGGIAGGALLGALIGWVAEAPFAGAIIGAGLGGFGGYVAGKSSDSSA